MRATSTSAEAILSLHKRPAINHQLFTTRVMLSVRSPEFLSEKGFIHPAPPSPHHLRPPPLTPHPQLLQRHRPRQRPPRPAQLHRHLLRQRPPHLRYLPP